MFDRPNTKSASAREGTDAMFPRYEHSDKQSVLGDKPVTDSLMSRSGGTAKSLSDVHSEMVDRPVKGVGDGREMGVIWTPPKGEHSYADNPPDTEPERIQYKVVTDCRCSTVSEFSDKRSQCRGRHDPE